MVDSAAQELGKRGGQAKSEAKTKAARKNASKPRGKWVTAFAFVIRDGEGKTYFGQVVVPRKMDLGLDTNEEELWGWILKAIRWANPANDLELVEFTGKSIRV